MDDIKHVVVVAIKNTVVTMEKTQKQLSDLLKDDSVELISVNADKPIYRRKRRKQAKMSVEGGCSNDHKTG